MRISVAKKSSIFFNFLDLPFRKLKAVIKAYSGSEEIFKAKYSDLRQIVSLTESDIEKIISLRNSSFLEQEWELIEKEGIECIDIFDKDYPLLLKEIGSPPLVIYLKGNRNVLSEDLFAIVGSRKPTTYGISVAKSFSRQLSELGIVIVSGLAMGIDTMVHQEAVREYKSVAVLGSGLLNIYPRENKLLAENISRQGAVISEFPLRMSPLKENFPRRNRIISGLSKGVLVIEAAKRSGALITAHLASEQNREVFAIPGSINSAFSKGTHALIKEGAKLVDCLEDIVEELKY